MMRYNLITTAILTLLSVQGAAQDDQELGRLEWLLGAWERVEMPSGKSAHERWHFEDGVLMGWGISMAGGDTTFVEKLQIRRQDGESFYIADVPENPKPVGFKIIELSDNHFIAENSNHDFPKKIEYLAKGDSLRVRVSGDGRTVEFVFKRQE